MKGTREPSAQRFWSIPDRRLRLFAEADKSALAVLARTKGHVFQETIPFLYADIPSKHAMKALKCPVMSRTAVYGGTCLMGADG
jgi:hypothetical protein